MKFFGLKIFEGESEQFTYRGERVRKPTLLIKVGRVSLSWRAFLLGLLLALCQVFDGILTYVGLSLMGVRMEGNRFLRELMEAYGAAPVLFVGKIIALSFVVLLTFQAHRRPWIRYVLVILYLIYLAFAVIPWVYILNAKAPGAAIGG